MGACIDYFSSTETPKLTTLSSFDFAPAISLLLLTISVEEVCSLSCRKNSLKTMYDFVIPFYSMLFVSPHSTRLTFLSGRQPRTVTLSHPRVDNHHIKTTDGFLSLCDLQLPRLTPAKINYAESDLGITHRRQSREIRARSAIGNSSAGEAKNIYI